MSLLRRRRDDAVADSPVLVAGPKGRAEVALEANIPEQDLVPCVRYAIRREPDAAIDTGRSKLGGAPDLPTGTAWPSVTRGGPGGEKTLLQFFAQLDLADAAEAAPGDLGLPTSGLLSFFAAADPENPSVVGPEALVLYTPPETLMHRMGLRMAPVPTAQLHPLGAWSWPGSSRDQSQEADLRGRTPDHCLVTGRHQLGGHVDGASGVLLLQFDSDLALEVAWGAGDSDGDGRLVWSASPADFAAGRWDAAQFDVL